MSKHDQLRSDNECQNCGHTVVDIYCGHCGQKNTETRQSFMHLVTHFAEDLTHYDSGFWKTIKLLLFRPASLTKEYLIGRRQKYVPPVKLYIFISFITFFLPAIIPDYSEEKEAHGHTKTEKHETTDSKSENPIEFDIAVNDKTKNNPANINGHTYKTLDDVEKRYEKGEIGLMEYYLAKAQVKSNSEDLTSDEIVDSFVHTLPKVLFIYMPIFAFWLWLFHGKKRWYFFDHGIFTLHYFSFLLLVVTIFTLILRLSSYIFKDDMIAGITFGSIFSLYAFFYFFRAHSKMYGEKKYISRLKSAALFVLNMICIFFALTFSFIYAILHTH